jgi:hypothetical protein
METESRDIDPDTADLFKEVSFLADLSLDPVNR